MARLLQELKKSKHVFPLIEYFSELFCFPFIARELCCQRKTEMLRTVLDERKNVLAFFELLEQTSHPGVVFGEFTGDAKTGTFTLMGEAQNFFVLEQQRLVWKEQKEFRYMLNDIQLGEGGKSGFEVE